MKLFAQIRKVDEEKRLVFGRLAEESVDKADEIMDYMSSKPHFQKWSADIAKDTAGRNLGNVRAMHGKVAAGGLTAIDFNDAEKAIDVCAKIIDDQEWKKVLGGIYTGFSIGGSYVGDKKVEKADGRDVTRYTANPSEASLVDRPCIPGAKFFEIQKADGSLQKVDFATPPVLEDDVQVNGTAEEVAELGKLMNTHGLALGDLIKGLPAFLKDKVKGKDGEKADDKPADEDEKDPEAAKKKKAAAEKAEQGTLRKGVYDCQSFANVLSSLLSLQSSAVYEAFREKDNSPLPAQLGAIIAMVGDAFKQLIDECIGEAAAGTEGSPAGAAMIALSEQAAGLSKATSADFAKIDADPIVALLKIGARNSSADTARLAKIHEMTVELGHECAPAKKADAPADLAKLDTGTLEKLVADAVAPLQKALTDAGEKIKKLEAQPAPARVSLRAVSKGEDLGGGDAQDLKKDEPIVDQRGEKHEVAGLIKSLHQSGGVPLAMPASLRK